MREPPVDKDQVERPLAQYLVGDVDAPTLCILRSWRSLHGGRQNMNAPKKAVKLPGTRQQATVRAPRRLVLPGLASSSASPGSEVPSEDLGDGLRAEAELKHGDTRVDILPVAGDPAALQLEETHPP